MVGKVEPLVSVGIPTYNRPEGLRRTLECILKQTYQNLEIIVSDNCSPDLETEKVVRGFMESDPRIRYFRQKHNVGMFYNFKFVAEVARGDYFTWAADDDERDSEFIEACIQGFQQFDQSSQLLLVNTFSQLIDPMLGKVLKTDKGCTTLGLPAPLRYKKYISSIWKEQAAVGDLIYGVIKRDALSQVMAGQPNIVAWDHVFLAHLSLKGEFYTIAKPLMRSSPAGISKTSRAKIAKAQLIEHSLSAKKSLWVREICLQRKIRESSNLSLTQKLQLATWSYWHYLTTHGLKRTVKELFPEPYEVLQLYLGKQHD